MDREHAAEAREARVQLQFFISELGNVDVETQFDARRNAVAEIQKLEAGKAICPAM